MKKIILIVAIATFFTTISFAQKGSVWFKKNYSVSGNWSIETNGTTSYLVLQSNFKTSKGPDLKLFLTKKSTNAIGKSDAVEKYGVLLGELKSYKGEQKYLIPNGLSISDFKSIVIHCEKYTKVWGASSI
jgi:hypothetical protein